MADEVKKAGSNVQSMTKMAAGFIVLLLGVLLTVRFFWALRILVAGCIGPFMILAGLVIIAIAKE